MRILINKQNNDKFKYKKSFCFNRELYHFHFCRQADCFVRMLHINSINVKHKQISTHIFIHHQLLTKGHNK